MLRLQCVAQNYDWGLKGNASTVGQLYALGSGQPIAEATPYAELWMGTHPSGPSKILLEDASGTMLLKDWLAAHPEALGEKVDKKWSGQLPFLFKVLSVAKALSIQAHPDKGLAERLHQEQPRNYKDDNHKPEMALAVTPFEALCAFVPMEELQEALATVPELKAAVGAAGAAAVAGVDAGSAAAVLRGALRSAFTELMTRDKGAVEELLGRLSARLREEKKSRQLSPKEELILRVEQQYPGDVGVLSIYFLNHLTLQEGEAIALAANEPHAYLAGECIECMAASDNVVRAGLTPKYRDTDTLCSMLTYNQGPPEILRGSPVDKCTSVYTPPFDEFEVERIRVPLGEAYPAPALPGPSILLAFKGNGAISQEYAGQRALSGLKVGDVFFIPAGAKVELSAVIEAEEGAEQTPFLEVYRARVNNRALQ